MTSDPVSRYLAQRGAKLDRRTRLRTMTEGEIMDMALRIYRLLGWTFLRLTVVPSLFCLAALGFVLTYVLPSLVSTSDASSVTTQLSEVTVAIGLGLLIGGPLFLIGLSYTSSLVIRLVADFMVGRTPDPIEAQRVARAQLPRLFILTLREMLLSTSGVLASIAVMMLGGWLSSVTPDTDTMAGLLALIGVLGLVGGGIMFLWVVGRHALAPAACVVEGVSARVAAKRSSSLMKSQLGQGSGASAVMGLYAVILLLTLMEWGGIAGTFYLLGIRQHVEEIFAGMPFQGLLLTATDLLPAYLVVWTILPVWATTVTIIYYERRIRLEGYDIEALAADALANRANRFDL